MTLRFRWLATAGLCIVATACGEPLTSPSAHERITELPRELTRAEQRLIDADNRFALKLFGALSAATRDTLPNLFVSPLSIAMALGMTYNGAAGTTEAAMRETLELQGFTLEEVNRSYRDLLGLLRDLDPQVRMLLANSIWARQGVTFEPAFLEANRTYFDATTQALDFADPAAPDIINDWVRQATRGLITEIVPSPIPDYVVMYLLNAIYFKGDWRQQFDTARTRDAPFRLADGSTTTVQMMSHGGPAEVRTFSDAGVQIIDIPYGGAAFSMTIVLPPEPGGIEALVAGLTAERWNAWSARLTPESALVFLPKFKLVNDLSLKDVLSTLGMGIAFDCTPPEMADFGRMRPERDVCITRVKHKSYVDVNEEGTEAAAVTSVEIGLTCVCGPPTIVVDRPFVFAIRENLSGTILFFGRVLNPAIRPVGG